MNRLKNQDMQIKELYYGMYDTLPLPVIVLKQSGVIQECNNAAIDFIGLDNNSLLKKNVNITDFILKKDYKLFNEQIIQVLKGEEVINFFRFVINGIGIMEKKVVLIPLEFENKVSNIALIVQDYYETTNHIHTTERIRNYVLKSHRTNEFGSWEVDMKRKRVIYCTDKVFEIYGIKPDIFNFDYNGLMRSVHPEDDTPVQQIEESLMVNDFIDFDKKIVRSDGVVRTIKMVVKRIDDSYLVGAIIDVTELKTSNQLTHESEDHNQMYHLVNSVSFETYVEKCIKTHSDSSKIRAMMVIEITNYIKLMEDLGITKVTLLTSKFDLGVKIAFLTD